MEQLLALYAELVRGAEDHQIPMHLNNLIQDAAVLTEAVKNVIDQARQKGAQVTATPAQPAQ
jgi:hypothetical protein